jgi:hypothetical protein
VERRETESGLRLGVALWWFLLLHPYLSEQREQLAALLNLTDSDPQPGHCVSPIVRAKALVTVGALAWAWGDLAKARSFLTEGLDRSNDLADRWGICVALIGLGHVARVQHDYAAAQRMYEKALVVAREEGDQRLVTFPVYFLGVLCISRATTPGHERSLRRAW